MKMTNQEIINFANMMLGDKHLPVKFAFAIHKNAKTIEPALKAYNETRKGLIEQYAKKDDEGKPIIEDDKYTVENVEQFNADMNDLLTEETEVEIHKVSVDELAKLDDPRFDALTVSEMTILNFMIEE
jgi:hypothetical protein